MSINEAYCATLPTAKAWKDDALPAYFLSSTTDKEINSFLWTIFFTSPSTPTPFLSLRTVIENGIIKSSEEIPFLPSLPPGEFPAIHKSGREALANLQAIGFEPTVNSPVDFVWGPTERQWYWGIRGTNTLGVSGIATVQAGTPDRGALDCDRHPTILLPGILGSWTDNFFEPFVNPNPIIQNQLSLTEESHSQFWRQLDTLGFLPHTWEYPKTLLPEAGFKTYKCPYDWRLPNADIAREYLIPCIDKAKQETGASKVNIVAHSMGGIVARSYIQDDLAYRNDVDKFVMLGTPNHGSSNAYYLWEGADPLNGWFGILGSVLEEAVGSRLEKASVHFLRIGLVNYFHAFFPSVRELLPTFDYLKDELGLPLGVSTLVWQNPTLPDLNNSTNTARFSSATGTKIFAGEGYPTLETIHAIFPNPDNIFADPAKPYPDGLPLPLLEEKNIAGDKAVLSQKSANLPEAAVSFETKTKSFSDPESFLEHTNLPNAFFDETLSFLGGNPTTTTKFSPILPKEALAISLASPADLLVTDSEGRRLGFDTLSQSEKYEIPKGVYSGRDELELAVIIDPPPGEYSVSVFGNGTGEFDTGISYAKEGCRGVVTQDNLGQTKPGFVTTFVLSIHGGCAADSVEYFLPATVEIDPNTIDLKSNGNFVTAFVELPEGYDVATINVASMKLNGIVPAISSTAKINERDRHTRKTLEVKFSRQALQSILAVGEQTIVLSGNLLDGTRIGGSDLVRVIE